METSFLILTRITNTAEAVEGDARTSPPGLRPRETTPAPWRMGAGATSSSPASPEPPSAGPEPRVRRGSRTGRFNNVADGKYLTNRTGHKLCADFNKGTRTEMTQGIWCQNMHGTQFISVSDVWGLTQLRSVRMPRCLNQDS